MGVAVDHPRHDKGIGKIDGRIRFDGTADAQNGIAPDVYDLTVLYRSTFGVKQFAALDGDGLLRIHRHTNEQQ